MNKISRMATGIAATLAVGGVSGAASARDATLAMIVIEGTPANRPAGMSLFAEPERTLLDYVETFDTVAEDSEFDGLVIRLKDAALSTSQIEEMGRALDRVRATGKPVHIFAENYGTGELLLGAHADEIIIQQGGGVSMPGLHMEEMFLADTLAWAGVKADLVQVGDFKGANEQMTRSEPSEAWNENIEGLLDSMYSNVRTVMKAGRSMDDNQLDDAMRIAWWADGSEAIDAGLIDAEVDLVNLKSHLGTAYDGTVSWVVDPYQESFQSIDYSNPFAVFGSLLAEPDEVRITDPTIAVLHVDGTIIDGDSTEGGLFGGGSSVGSRTIRNAIEEIIRQPLIQGVVVRVDSPGGSAIASEVMWLGLERLREHKPVWVSVGSMAASGGYYVLSAGEKVYVNDSSIVGSIGVVGGKYAMGGLYDKAKINIVERSRGPVASLASTVDPWSSSEIEMVRSKMKKTYDLFASRVTAGRPGIDLGKTAEGRLFTGTDAVELRMADAIGGLDDAINALAAELDMRSLEIAHFPKPPSFEEMLENMFGGIVQSPVGGAATTAGVLREVLGDQRFETFADAIGGMMLLRDEPVLLVSPRAIHIR